MEKSKKNNQFDRSHLKFVFNKVRFQTEGETTKCIIHGRFVSTWGFYDVVKRVFKQAQFSKVGVFALSGVVVGGASFEAVVKCSKEDKYDENVGKRIAESKCKAKIYAKSMELVGNIADETELEVQRLKKLGLKYISYHAKEQIHQDYLDAINNGEDKK